MGAAAMLAIFALGRGLPSLIAWRSETQREREELRAEWARAIADVQAAPSMRDSARARRVALGDALPSLVRGTTPAVAGGELASLASEAANGAGVRIGAVDVRVDSSSRAFYAHLTLATDVTGDVRGIAQFLAQLEGGDTRLRLRTISIAQPEPYASATQPEALHASLVLQALARRPPSPASRPTRGERP
jgi:hypothetical protein